MLAKTCNLNNPHLIIHAKDETVYTFITSFWSRKLLNYSMVNYDYNKMLKYIISHSHTKNGQLLSNYYTEKNNQSQMSED